MDDTAEISRQLGDLLRQGTVSAVEGTRCRVLVDDDFSTDWIPMPVWRAGKVRVWSRLSIGEQVMIACPEGEIAAAAVVAVISSDAFPPPADDDRTLILFDDACEISYDPETHHLQATLPAAGVIDLAAPGGVNIAGDVTITGQLQATGRISSDDDVRVGAISLKNHKHGQVQAGAVQSGGPV